MKKCPNCGKELYDYAQKCDGCGLKILSPSMQTIAKIDEIYNSYCKAVKKKMVGADDIILDFYYGFVMPNNTIKNINDWIDRVKESPESDFQKGSIYALSKLRDFFIYIKQVEKEIIDPIEKAEDSK